MTILKAIDANNQTYFALRIEKGSHEMLQIKTCPVRYWDAAYKVWLIPYSVDNWSMIRAKIGHNNYNISQETLNISHTILKPKTTTKAQSITPKWPKPLILLSTDHQCTINKLKEQLIIQRYQPSTHKSYISCMTEFLVFYHDRATQDITTEDIRRFIIHKIETDKIKESTQNSLINAIKFYYEKVEKREKFNLYDLRPRKPNTLPGFLSKEDTVKLLTCTSNLKHKTILQLIYSSGMRLGELTRLKVRNIKFDMDIIEIKCAKGKKDRITKLSSKVKVLLTQYIDMYKPKYYLFEGQTGGKYSDRSVQNIMHAAVIKSGVDENATVHTLRHTFATHLVLDGVDIRTVQELLGHNSPETTAIYTHITDKMKKDVKSPLDNLDI
ncbi:MAG: site-specific integrase [Lewinellaceae bacterium]|nr:site-specific integrase [Lewinellaceae bacterium]